jgi:superfamily II DNA or RNA helicase
MPAYRFSWDPFDDRTVTAFAADVGFQGPAESAREYLRGHVSRPNDDFVRKTKDSITRVWLPQYAGVGTEIVRELFDMHIGPMGVMPMDAEGCARYISRCRNSSGLRGLLADRLISFGDSGREEEWREDGDFVPRFGTVAPFEQTISQQRPYIHQTDAWAELDRHLSDSTTSGVFKGVLVMPTGSGKTQTAVHWLLRQWINDGNRVLWVAHRDELLRQAARTFYRLAGLAFRRNRLRVRLVSGRHCRFHQIDPADDVVLCSVQSLARAGQMAADLLHDPRLFVVVDEAHHAPAKSYREAIAVLAKAASHRLLGLTATPTRTVREERPELARLFGDRVLYQVSASELIGRELLARPIPITVQTGVDAEKGMTADDLAYVRDFHDLSSEMSARLGRDQHRNLEIVKHYLDNRENYGKTLVFATDVEGACLLADAFRTHPVPVGVEAAYVASWRPDLKEGERVDDREILRQYRDPTSGLDVLINVDMLTEGVDLPMTRTVFLARPTSSEVLLRQMIGRALRGPAAGGNLEANIVSFEDHWEQFRDWLSPIDLLADFPARLATSAELPPHPEPAPRAGLPDGLPPVSWDVILATSRAIRERLPESESDVFEAVPHGMYVLDYEIEGESVRAVIHVYEHQLTCWQAFFAFLSHCDSADLEGIDIEGLDAEYFRDCEVPKPSTIDIATIVERVRKGDPLPEYVPLEGRALCDPRQLAALARQKDMRGTEVTALLNDRLSPLARVLYPSLVDFRRAFDDAMREIEFPETAPQPKGTVIFEPLPSNPLQPGPYHDLQKLFAEMLAQGSRLLGRPLQHDGSVEWSRRVIKGWFGMADFLGPGRGLIRINCLFDSVDVSAAAMKFLLWHEYLHVHLAQLHTPEFRRLERMWPDYAACNREMDALHEKFGIQYWYW